MAPIGAADFGVAGDLAENLLWRVENGELAGAPRVAVVEIGTNNLGVGESVGDTVAAVESVVDAVRAISPSTQVVLMGLLPRGSADDSIRGEIGQANADLAAWAPTSASTFLDIGPAVTAAGGSIAADFLPDELHPNADGYQAWADSVEGVVLGLLDAPATAVATSGPVAASTSSSGTTTAPTTVASSSSPTETAEAATLVQDVPAMTDPASLLAIGAAAVEVEPPTSPVATEEQGQDDAEQAPDQTAAEVVTEAPVTTARVGQSLADDGFDLYVDYFGPAELEADLPVDLLED